MVVFENNTERDYFSNRMLIGEVARVTLAKIFLRLKTVNGLSRDEIMAIQKEAVAEIKSEVSKLDQEEKANQTKHIDNGNLNKENIQ